MIFFEVFFLATFALAFLGTFVLRVMRTPVLLFGIIQVCEEDEVEVGGENLWSEEKSKCEILKKAHLICLEFPASQQRI